MCIHMHAGTLDPTPSIYNTTMYTMAALLCGSMICNANIRCAHPGVYYQLRVELIAQGVQSVDNLPLNLPWMSDNQ